MAVFPMINLVVGIVLLIFGRKLFWLFVGAAGFLVGMELAERYFAGSDARLLIAVAAGVVAALLAILFYKVALAISGFVVGGYATLNLMHHIRMAPPESMAWLPYVIGGIIGAVLILLLLDWALILLSSLAGASLILASNVLQQFEATAAFLILVVVGILIQAAILFRGRSVEA